MTLEQKPFVRYNEEKVRDSFTMNLNEEERKELDLCKKILQQPKDSTALKQLAHIGAIEIQTQKTTLLIDTLFKNKKNNQRLGITENDLS